MEEDKALTKSVGIDTALKTGGGLIPHNLDQLWRLACMMAKSGMMPKGIQTPEAVAVAVQMGLEVGLSPMSAVQNIAVINGRPSIWGDSVLGLVRASGLLEDFDEYFEIDGKRLEPGEVDQYLTSDKLTAICVAKRKDQEQLIMRGFSIADAKTANLWEKKSKDGYPSTWMLYPKRMLQMRPRSWTLRDGFGDVIKGLKVAEEVIDMVTTNGQSFELGGSRVADLNEKLKGDPGKSTGDIYKTEEATEEPEPDKEEEKEDQIRKLYINLRKPGFKEFVHSHKDAIPNMEAKYQDEIRSKWLGFYPDEPYPLDEPKEAPKDVPPDSMNSYGEGMQGGEDKPEPPIMLNCPLSYNDRKEKNDEGRVNVDVCENVCEGRDKCVAYSKYQANITT